MTGGAGGGSGGQWQTPQDTGGGYDTGPSYIKEGSPFSPYNGGIDQGQQTQGYNPGVGPGGYDPAGNWIPSTNQVPANDPYISEIGDGLSGPTPMSAQPGGNGFNLAPGAIDPAITPFTNTSPFPFPGTTTVPSNT